MANHRGYIGFGLTWHWGDPRNPLELKAYFGKLGMGGTWRQDIVRHPVRKWYGLSNSGSWAAVFMLLDRRIDERVPCDNPLPATPPSCQDSED